MCSSPALCRMSTIFLTWATLLDVSSRPTFMLATVDYVMSIFTKKIHCSMLRNNSDKKEITTRCTFAALTSTERQLKPRHWKKVLRHSRFVTNISSCTTKYTNGSTSASIISAVQPRQTKQSINHHSITNCVDSVCFPFFLFTIIQNRPGYFSQVTS